MTPKTLNEYNPNETADQETQSPADPYPRIDWGALFPGGQPDFTSHAADGASAGQEMGGEQPASEQEPVEVPNRPAAAPESPNGKTVHPIRLPAAPIADGHTNNRPSEARRWRRANPKEDNIWTRHHAICLMGAICDIALGGYETARNAALPLKSGVNIPEVITAALNICPWLLNATYLNLTGSVGIEEQGLERCYRTWASNRVYYFYREPSEHPCNRKKSNLSAVYRDFYYAFADAIEAGTAIEEQHAKEFWIEVSNRVPFRPPASEVSEPTPTSAVPQEGGAL